MRIYFRDEIGLIMVEVDKYGISFVEGVAIFSTEGGDVYRHSASDGRTMGKLFAKYH